MNQKEKSSSNNNKRDRVPESRNKTRGIRLPQVCFGAVACQSGTMKVVVHVS